MAKLDKRIFDMLKSEAQADKNKALLSLDLLKNFPSGRTRGSFPDVISPPGKFGLFSSIVANFKRLNVTPFKPTRFCRYKILCSPLNKSRKANGNSSGKSRIIAAEENNKSKN